MHSRPVISDEWELCCSTSVSWTFPLLTTEIIAQREQELGFLAAMMLLMQVG